MTSLVVFRFTFECRLECDTKSPVIEWFKDGKPIQNPDMKQIYRDGLCQLVIEKTFTDDTASFTCKAKTDAGVTETSGTLRVRGQFVDISLYLARPCLCKQMKAVLHPAKVVRK